MLLLWHKFKSQKPWRCSVTMVIASFGAPLLCPAWKYHRARYRGNLEDAATMLTDYR